MKNKSNVLPFVKNNQPVPAVDNREEFLEETFHLTRAIESLAFKQMSTLNNTGMNGPSRRTIANILKASKVFGPRLKTTSVRRLMEVISHVVNRGGAGEVRMGSRGVMPAKLVKNPKPVVRDNTVEELAKGTDRLVEASVPSRNRIEKIFSPVTQVKKTA